MKTRGAPVFPVVDGPGSLRHRWQDRVFLLTGAALFFRVVGRQGQDVKAGITLDKRDQMIVFNGGRGELQVAFFEHDMRAGLAQGSALSGFRVPRHERFFLCRRKTEFPEQVNSRGQVLNAITGMVNGQGLPQ